MPIVEGRYVASDPDTVLDNIFDVAQQRRDGNLSEDKVAVIKEFYRPVAQLITELQGDMREILDATRLEQAEDTALDLLTNLIGVTREPAKSATVQQKFYYDTAQSTDTAIPKGTAVQTGGTDPKVFETTEKGTIPAGTTSVTLDAKAVETGAETNVGANTIETFTNSKPDSGLKTTNPSSATGGRDQETDEELRERAKQELSEGSKATGPAIVSSLQNLSSMESVTVFINDTNTDNYYGNGLPAISMEVVVDYHGTMQDVYDTLAESKGACAPLKSGINGTANDGTYTYPNGQTFTIKVSEPTDVDIYVDCTLTYEDGKYAGDAEVEDAIVNYIGGTRNDGELVQDGLGVGDDVLIGEVEAAIREVAGVYDIASGDLTIGTADNPTGTTNISILAGELATTDATTTTHINITSNVK